MIKNRAIMTVKAVVLLLCSQAAMAGSFSFTGNFTTDSDIQFFNFSLAADSTSVTIKTLSLNGGSNFAGNSILSGGFDPYLVLFDQATGNFMGDTLGKLTNNEAILPLVGTLLAGNYILALTQYDNVVAGLNLSDGFASDLGLYTPPAFLFNELDGHWAVDILEVTSASSNVPAPETMTLVLIGLIGFIAISKRKSLGVPVITA